MVVRRWFWPTLIALLLVVGGIGWAVGSASQSPSQAAARAEAPEPSWITTAVERRVLSATLIQRGDVKPEVSVSVRVPSSVEDAGVVTQVAVVAGDLVTEGTKVIEVSGRPVFVLAGDVQLQRRNTASRPLGGGPLVPIVAATPGAILASRPTIATGRIYDQFHEQRAERVAVLGAGAAAELGIIRIDNQPAVFIGDTAYTVLGVLADVERNPDLLASIMVPATTERSTIASTGGTYEALIDTSPGAAPLAGLQAPPALRPEDPDRLRALVPSDPDTLRNEIESDVTALYLALAGLALLIGTIAIANATLPNIIERRPEIGLRSALGAKRQHIARQITLEAAIIGTFAGIAGTNLAILAVAAYCENRGWTMTLDPKIIFIAPLIGLLIGALAGVLPAIRAARTPPAITLRT